MVGHSPAPPWGWKEGMCSADCSRSGCLREWQRMCGALCYCGTVHYPYPSVCISIVLARKESEPKRQATGKGFLSRDSYVSVHSHLLVGCMIHIQAEWEQQCCSCFNDLPCHSSYLQPHVDVACCVGRDTTGLGWPVWPVWAINCGMITSRTSQLLVLQTTKQATVSEMFVPAFLATWLHPPNPVSMLSPVGSAVTWTKADNRNKLHKVHKMNTVCHDRKQEGNMLKQNGQQRK